MTICFYFKMDIQKILVTRLQQVKCNSIKILTFRCNVILNLPDTVHKMEISDDHCESCETTLLSINYHKVKTSFKIYLKYKF